MDSNQKILAAVPRPALVALERALGGYVQLIPAHTLDEALRQLQTNADISLILCGACFDESRMFDLLRVARKKHPATPFVCCRILDTETFRISIKTLIIPSEGLGAATFIDVPTLAWIYGLDGADQRFRSIILTHLSAKMANVAAR